MTEIYVRRTSMGARVAVCQVLRWTVTNAAYSVFSPLQFGTCRFQPLWIGCRLFCPSTTQNPLPSAQHNNAAARRPTAGMPDSELSLASLVDMGFTDAQAEQIHEAVCKVRGGSAAKHALSTLTALFSLGFNPSSVLKMLQKCPELYTARESQLQQCIKYLWKLGFVEGSLQRTLAHYPQILTVPVKTIKHVVLLLREKCLFTVQQVADIFRDSPAIVLEDLSQTEYKFQYVYFRMGIKQAEMVKTRLFRFTLDEVRCRHCFLERRGLYQTPDKRGQTSIINPKLDSILKIDLDTYLSEIANASAEEYDVFQRLMAREWQEQDQQYDSIEADSEDDNDEDEDEDEDEESGGKSGYRKRAKK